MRDHNDIESQPIITLHELHIHNAEHVLHLLKIWHDQRVDASSSSSAFREPSNMHLVSIHRVVWNLHYHRNEDGLGQVLMHPHCCIAHLELNISPTTPRACRLDATSTLLLTQLVSHPTLSSLCVRGEASGAAADATLNIIYEGLRQRTQSNTTLQSISWQVVSHENLSAEPDDKSFGFFVDALIASKWSGPHLRLATHLNTRHEWKDLIRLLVHPNVDVCHLDLDVSEEGFAPPPPAASSDLQALVQCTSLQSLLLHGTAVLECWDALPDHLAQVLLRNRLLAHVQQLDQVQDGELPWLVTQLLNMEDDDDDIEMVTLTPVYTLIRNYYLGPNHHGG